jgi:hypothetical protein
VPRFLDVHSMKGLDEDILKKLQDSPQDEFSVKHLNILYNPEADKCFCVLEAPTKEAVENHHEKMGIKCEWITEVKTTA